MSTRLVIRPEASLDLEEALHWYEEQREGLGERLTAEIDDLLARISEAPLQFPAVGKGGRRGLLHHFPYAVYFLLKEDVAVVIAILHQRRDPDAWKRRI